MSGTVYIGPSLTRSLAAMFVLLALPGLPASALPDTFGVSGDDDE